MKRWIATYSLKFTDVSRDLYYLYNLKNMKENPWESATLLKVTLLHGCFSCFLNCTNGTKSRNVPQFLKRKLPPKWESNHPRSDLWSSANIYETNSYTLYFLQYGLPSQTYCWNKWKTVSDIFCTTAICY